MMLLQQLAGNDSQLQQAMQMATQGDPRQTFFNLAKERGLSEEQAKQYISQLGIQLPT